MPPHVAVTTLCTEPQVGGAHQGSETIWTRWCQWRRRAPALSTREALCADLYRRTGWLGCHSDNGSRLMDVTRPCARGPGLKRNQPKTKQTTNAVMRGVFFLPLFFFSEMCTIFFFCLLTRTLPNDNISRTNPLPVHSLISVCLYLWE